MLFAPLGDSAVTVTLGEGIDPKACAAVSAFATALANAKLAGVCDVVPAYASVAVFYDPAHVMGEGGTPYEKLCAEIARAGKDVERVETGAVKKAHEQRARMVEIAVYYGGEGGPDLAEVAAHTGLAEDEVVARHSRAEYLVQAIGFAPGFPYLSGLPAELATPRRASPRAKVPAGTVGIGGAQTGVYPLESPGGWQLIGRTAVKLFDAQRAEPALLRVGDRVKFRAACEHECHVIRDTRDPDTTGILRNDCHVIRDTCAGLRVVNGGMFTTVQDLGRWGQRAAGVPSGGAMDGLAARLANWLVGNEESAAVIEMTLLGPEIEFLSDMLIAVGGAEFADWETWRPVAVKAGQRIKWGAATKGCRGYLAVAGGIDVPVVLGSRSTYARAELGGWEGRALRAGDVLPLKAVARSVAEHWWIDHRILPEYSAAPTVRVVLGAQAGEFGDEWLKAEFKVTPQSDRMGMRLAGPALVRARGGDLLSSAVAPGTVQVPPDGQPIVLMADAQTIGGYPQLAHAISVDLPLLAQLRPGDTVRFHVVALGDAHQLWLAREYALAMLREGLAQKFR
jgi:KipI family sensor histidine kinase inhibitor